MGDYVSNYGYTIGPLQIEKSGTWLTHTTKKEPISVLVQGQNYSATKLETTSVVADVVDSQNTRYLAASVNKTINSSSGLSLLMARHPLCGTYPTEFDKDGNVIGSRPFCDLNAVPTVGWIMAYSALAPGSKALSLNDIIYRAEFNDISKSVKNLTTKVGNLEIVTDQLEQKIETLETATKDIDQMYWTKNVDKEGIIFVGWAEGQAPSSTWK